MLSKLKTLAEPIEGPGEQFLKEHEGNPIDAINKYKPRAISLLNTQSVKKSKSDILQSDLNVSESKGSDVHEQQQSVVLNYPF